MIQDPLPASALTGILDTLPGGVALVDAGARLLYLNRTLADWSGVAPGGVLGRDFADLFPTTADRDGLAATLRQALAGSPCSHRCDLRFTDAVVRRARVECIPQRAGDGSIWGASVIVTQLDQADFAQPAKDESALAGERAFADALIDSVPAIVLLLSPDGAIQRVNTYFEELSGYRLEEIRGKDWITTFLPERVRREIHGLIATAAGGKQTRGHVNAIVLRNGEEREIEWSDTTVRDESGRVVSVLAVGHDVTELLGIQADLHHGKERMRKVVRLSHIGIFEHNHDSDIIYWSPEQREIYGWTADEPVTLEKLAAHLHPEDTARVMAAIRRAHDPTGDGRFDIEYRIVRRDGAVRWVDNRSQTAFEDKGDGLRARRTTGATIDITARKLTEEALRASETRLRQAQAIARIGNWEMDHATGHLWWSDEIYRIFEIDQARFAASYDAFLAAIHPDDRAAIDRAYRDSIASRQPYQITHRLRMPDGREKWVEERCQTSYDSTGKPVSSTGTVQDITEQHRNETALREREDLLRQGARIGRFGTWVWDVSEDRCLVCSEELAALFGMTVEEFVRERGSDRQIRIEPLRQETYPAEGETFPEEGLPFEEEFRALTKHGEQRWFREIGQVYRDPATGRLWSVGVTQDVTETKNAEAELRRLIEESARLAQLAEQSNQAKSEFLATMSHELRTPLNAIIGFSELLMMFGANLDHGKKNEYHGIVLQSGRHLLSLINDILDLAKVESGKLELRVENVPLRELAEECVSYLAPAARPKALSIEIDIPEIDFESDRRLLKQLLLNILSNAVKFNREGGQVTIMARHYAEDDDVTISIEDTGIGMSPEEVERALQPFTQVENTYSRTQEGTGLGLTLAQRFTAIFGGEFRIVSQKGVGTVITIRLPRRQRHPERAAALS